MEKKISPIFGESVSTEKIKRRNYSSTEGTGSRSRFYLIPIALVLAIIIVLGRAFFLQVVRGSYYRNLSDNNRIKTIIIHAPRGIISDRQGKPLVYNIPGYRQTVNGKTRLIGQDEAITLISQGAKDLEIDSLRDYPYKESIAHVLGYLGQVSEDELKTSEFVNYNSGDVIGKMGIERQYEKFLKGEDGAALAEIDSQGKVVRKLGQSEGISGRNIKLTIDLDLQKKAYSAMGKVKKGALVVSTPTGEILALVSKPSFDSNLFTLGKDYKVANAASYKSVSEVLNDKENQPFLNRAIGGAYPPGSTFKIVVAVGGLADKIIGTKYSIKDTGVIKVGDFSFSNWYFTGYGGTDGDVNVIKGLKRSNDIFFYKLAEKIGVDRLSATAQKFGLGKILGLDLQGEVSGTVPTKEWKQEKIGESWYLGDTYNYGIGQGYLLTTPLQVNIWTQAIANNGNIYKPHLLKDLGDRKLNDRFLDQETINPIRQGMRESCSPGGVAWPLFEFKIPAKGWSDSGGKNKIDGKNFILEKATRSAEMIRIPIACKTGTAQHGGEHTLPHAWITLFAPAYEPEIIVTVLAEESGEGSSVAAPIAKEVLAEWFTRQIKN